MQDKEFIGNHCSLFFYTAVKQPFYVRLIWRMIFNDKTNRIEAEGDETLEDINSSSTTQRMVKGRDDQQIYQYVKGLITCMRNWKSYFYDHLSRITDSYISNLSLDLTKWKFRHAVLYSKWTSHNYL